MEVPTLIRSAREAAGLTQAQVALRAGTSQPTVASYERGRVAPSLSTLARLVRACGDELVVTRRRALRLPSQRLRQERRAVLELCDAAGVENVRVFGSVARGTDTADSDIDLLVDLCPGATLLELAGLREDLAELLGTTVDVATARMLKPEARVQALAEALPV